MIPWFADPSSGTHFGAKGYVNSVTPMRLSKKNMCVLKRSKSI